MKLGSGKAWAKTLGSAFAHVQHGLDKGVEWGFSQLNNASEPPKVINVEEKKYVRTAKNIVRGTASFFGHLGKKYYEEYEDLKRGK